MTIHSCHCNLGQTSKILGICGLPLVRQGIQDLFEDKLKEKKTQFEGMD
jgi:hypothetical protein